MKHLRYCRYLPRSQATYTTVTEPIPSDQLAASAQWPGALPVAWCTPRLCRSPWGEPHVRFGNLPEVEIPYAMMAFAAWLGRKDSNLRMADPELWYLLMRSTNGLPDLNCKG